MKNPSIVDLIRLSAQAEIPTSVSCGGSRNGTPVAIVDSINSKL